MPQPIKKRKREGTTDSKDFKQVRQTIRSLEAGLSDKTKLNNIVDILNIARDESSTAQCVHAAIHSLHRIFARLVPAGDLNKPDPNDKSASAAVATWLLGQYNEYLNLMDSLLSHEEPGLQVPTLNILMSLLKVEFENMQTKKKGYNFPEEFYSRIVNAILNSTNLSQHLFKEFFEKYVNAYDDLRVFFYRTAASVLIKTAKVAKDPKTKALVTMNAFSIMEAMTSMPTDPSEIDEFYLASPEQKASSGSGEAKSSDDPFDVLGDEGLVSDEDDDDKESSKANKKDQHPMLTLRYHRRSFTKCWVALLKMPLKDEYYKKILLILHKRILPHFQTPTLLMDFLTDSYNVGGAVSLLALNGLFVLVTEHNLDYPDFYHKLYTLLDRNVMHVKYRTRFFRLLDLFLSSAYLPASLVAAFIKRLARLSLTAPPAATVAIIPFIYNLLRRHPTCMKMIHKHDAVGITEDPYDFDEPNPYNSKAIESSLWEVQTLADHYYANVSTLAKIFTEKFTKPKYDIEDFMDHTYSTFFTTEIERKRKADPPLAFEKPGELEWEI